MIIKGSLKECVCKHLLMDFFGSVIKTDFWVFCEGENVRHICTYLTIDITPVNHHHPSLTIFIYICFIIIIKPLKKNKIKTSNVTLFCGSHHCYREVLCICSTLFNSTRMTRKVVRRNRPLAVLFATLSLESWEFYSSWVHINLRILHSGNELGFRVTVLEFFLFFLITTL